MIVEVTETLDVEMNVLFMVANGIVAVSLLALREDVADMLGNVRLCTVDVLLWYIEEFSTRLRSIVDDVLILVAKVGIIPVLFMVATEERFLPVVEGNTNVGVWDVYTEEFCSPRNVLGDVILSIDAWVWFIVDGEEKLWLLVEENRSGKVLEIFTVELPTSTDLLKVAIMLVEKIESVIVWFIVD